MAMSLPSQVPHDAEATNLEREAVSLPNNQENAPVAHFKAVQALLVHRWLPVDILSLFNEMSVGFRV